jgi:peptide/nickel transport system permease protein
MAEKTVESRGPREGPWARGRTALEAGGAALRWGAVLVVMLVIFAAVGPLLAPYPPEEQLDIAARQRPPGTVLFVVALAHGGWRLADRVRRTPEGLEIERLGRVETLRAERVANLTADGVDERRVFVLGTDGLGRDLLSRILYGGRNSLAIGLLSVLLAVSVGVLVGSAAALGGRLVDGLLMRLVDALLSFPTLFLLLALAGLFGPSGLLIVLILGGTTWMSISRLARAEILSLEGRDFVAAARATGSGTLRILWRHLLPNALNPVLVRATLLIADVILAESSLSFLQMGVQPPTPTWGNIIADGRTDLVGAWWVSAFPGLAIAVTVIAFNLLGDGLREVLDPRNQTS